MKALKPRAGASAGAGAGFGVGVVVTWLLLRRGDVLHSPAWQEQIAWQGWVGAALTAAATVWVARSVLDRTLKAEREAARADRQTTAAAGLMEAFIALYGEGDAARLRERASTVATRLHVWLMTLAPGRDALSGDVRTVVGWLVAARTDRALEPDLQEWSRISGKMVEHLRRLHEADTSGQRAAAEWFAAERRTVDAKKAPKDGPAA